MRMLVLAAAILAGPALAQEGPAPASPFAALSPAQHHLVIDRVVGACLARCRGEDAAGLRYPACNSRCMATSLPAQYPTRIGFQAAARADEARLGR